MSAPSSSYDIVNTKISRLLFSMMQSRLKMTQKGDHTEDQSHQVPLLQRRAEDPVPNSPPSEPPQFAMKQDSNGLFFSFMFRPRVNPFLKKRIAKKQCHHCNAPSSSHWRSGPEGATNQRSPVMC